MNISARIRSLIGYAMTAAQIHELMPDVDVKLIRGCIQTMVRVGIADRIGDKKPYQYKVARSLKPQKRGFRTVIVTLAERIRNLLEANGPMVNAQVAEAIGEPPKETSRAMFDMKRRGYIRRSDDGSFTFVSHPPKRVYLTPAEYTAKIAAEKRKRESRIAIAKSKLAIKSKPMTVVKAKEKPEPMPVKAQTVDEWLAEGGVIDRSPTPLPFERLSRADIDMSYRAASTAQLRTTRTYLVG